MSKTVLINNKIVEDCKLNKAKAQMQLYDLYCNAMFVIACRYVKDTFVAEDVMQDAFIETFKGEVTIGAWIKRIVINQCIDYLKKKKIELVSLEENQQIQIANDDWSVNKEVTVEIISDEIKKLPEKYRVVLNLYLIEGYDHQEISQILNITEVTSRSQLMRGKSKLKNQLKAYNYA